MANTTILLREDIDTLGGRGEIVKVRAGYARNYLLPQGLATLATKGNVKQIEQERAALLKKAAVERATAEALQAKGYEIDRRKISLRDSIKETGDYTVKVKLHREVTLEVPVTVTAEGGDAAESPKAEKKGRKAKAEAVVDEPAAETAAE